MIRIIAVGKCKEKATLALIAEYAKRLQAYTKMEVIEVADEKTLERYSTKEQDLVKAKEGQRILEKIKTDDFVILLELRGETMDSESFAKRIDLLFTQGKSNLVFVIGGSLGTTDEVYQRANLKWKLSDLTFPHQLVRVILLEQIYRAYTILNNTPYHK